MIMKLLAGKKRQMEKKEHHKNKPKKDKWKNKQTNKHHEVTSWALKIPENLFVQK